MCDRARFFEKEKLKMSQKCRKWTKNGPKTGVFEFIEKSGLFFFFFLNLVDKESLFYLLYSSTNPILRKNLVPKIRAKMLSVNQIAGSLNRLYP